MSRRPIATFHPVTGEPMVRKKTTSELEQAEIKLQSLFEKRDVLNAEASQVADGELVRRRSARMPSRADLPELGGVFRTQKTRAHRVLEFAQIRARSARINDHEIGASEHRDV